MPVPVFFLAAPLFALADRGIGGLLRRSFVYGGLILLAAAAVYVKLYPAAVMMVVWGVYRSLPWNIGGTTTPRTTGQIVGSLLRHALPVGGAFICWQQFGKPVEFLIPFLVYAAVATLLSVKYAHDVDALARAGGVEHGQLNEKVELTRGAAFGLALTLALTVFA